jgi:hypothetical protein
MLLLARQRVDQARLEAQGRAAGTIQWWWRGLLPGVLRLRVEVRLRLVAQQEAGREAAARAHMAHEERATRAFDAAQREAQQWERCKMGQEEALARGLALLQARMRDAATRIGRAWRDRIVCRDAWAVLQQRRRERQGKVRVRDWSDGC